MFFFTDISKHRIYGRDLPKSLHRKFRVIAVDLPGHGLSKVYSENHTMELMAGAVKGLLENLNINKYFLLVIRSGGYVALAFLELYPGMLKGYCLFHSHPFADIAETIEKREREIKIVRAAKKYLLYSENISQMYRFSQSRKIQ